MDWYLGCQLIGALDFLNLKSLLGRWLFSFCTAVLPVGSPAFSFFILFAKATATASLLLSLSSFSAGESQGVKMGNVRVSLEEGRGGVVRECQLGWELWRMADDAFNTNRQRKWLRLTSVVVPVLIHCLLELYLEPEREYPYT